MRPVLPEPRRAPRRRHSLVYLGIMGPQDGVDTILDVMDELVHRRGRDRRRGHAARLRRLPRGPAGAAATSWASTTSSLHRPGGPAMIAEHLSAADVGLCPDLKTPLNDVSTMNKTMEYMAYALPSVSFDLVETRVSGGGHRALRAVRGRRRRSPTPSSACSTTPTCASTWPWPRAGGWPRAGLAPAGPGVRRGLRRPHRPPAPPRGRHRPDRPGHRGPGPRRYVDLDDEAELRRFVLERTAPVPLP